MENAYRVAVHNQTETAEARRVAMRLAQDLSFDETDAGSVGLVVTEAAKNLLKHAGGGEVILRAAHQNGAAAVEMLALDSGPGIADLARSFEDGYSTAGTPGTGLGAISRLSNFHEVYSRPSQGTALLVRVRRRNGVSHAREGAAEPFRVGAVSVPMRGEEVCGDAWDFLQHKRGGVRLIVADGLGHGLLAADAARAAVDVSREYEAENGVALMERIHQALRSTRGAAVAIAEIDPRGEQVRYTGIGNIGAAVISQSGAVRRMVSHPGSAGHEVRKITEFYYPWTNDSVLLMHSDGLLNHWSLDRYPGLAQRHPALMAGILYRDFTRGRDDVTVAVVRQSAED